MSRIGKLPVVLPAGTKAELLDGNVVKVKGPLGEMSQKVDADITVTIEGNEIKFTRPSDLPRFRSMHGLYRALVHNMVVGVSEGFTIKQEFVGVGYRVAAQGQLLTMSLGYSHDIQIMLPKEITAETPQVRKGEKLALSYHTVTYANKLLLDGEAFRYTHHHVVHKCAIQTVH